MIQVNSRVKINDSYDGGIPNVIGRVGKVKVVAGNVIQLDIVGKRESSHYPGYFFDYNVIVHSTEVDEVPYGFKDMEGTPVDLGDTVVYASNRGNLTKGIVVDLKDETQVRWGDNRKELKFQIEYEVNEGSFDGGERRISKTVKKRMWLGNQHRTLVVQKNLGHLILFNGHNMPNVLDCGNE